MSFRKRNKMGDIDGTPADRMPDNL